MEAYNDPLLEAQFEGEEFETEEAKRPELDLSKFAGKWPNAMLMDATGDFQGQYGPSLRLDYSLKPDADLKFSMFVDVPQKPEENGSPDAYEKALKRYQIQLNRLKTLVHATGQWCEFNEKGYKSATKWPATLNSIDTEEKFASLLNLFKGLVGRSCGLNIKIEKFEGRDGKERTRKNVWGLDPKVEV